MLIGRRFLHSKCSSITAIPSNFLFCYCSRGDTGAPSIEVVNSNTDPDQDTGGDLGESDSDNEGIDEGSKEDCGSDSESSGDKGDERIVENQSDPTDVASFRMPTILEPEDDVTSSSVTAHENVSNYQHVLKCKYSHKVIHLSGFQRARAGDSTWIPSSHL